MLSKDDMQKAQAYPGRYGEHFCHSVLAALGSSTLAVLFISGKAVQYKQCDSIGYHTLIEWQRQICQQPTAQCKEESYDLDDS